MEIYVVLIEDRHCDVTVELYANRDVALGRAMDIALDRAYTSDDIRVAEVKGWEYYVEYSCESDSVRVEKVLVK